MTSKDKRTSRPDDGDESEAKDASDATVEHSVAPATSTDDSRTDRASQPGTWSPSDYPMLVISWKVIRTDEPEAPQFATTVALEERAAYPKSASAPLAPRQVVVDTTLSNVVRCVPFSVREETSYTPFLSGALRYEPGKTTASLTVTELKYPGGSAARVVLYP
jgi:hypothetical protein